MKTRPNLKGKVAIPTSTEYDASMLTGEATQDATQKSIVKRYELNSTAFGDLLLSINASAGSDESIIIIRPTTSENSEYDAKKT